MTTEVQALITRSTAIEQMTDPFGNKWGVGHKKQTSLYFIGMVKESNLSDSGTIIAEPAGEYPTKELSGMFTSPSHAQQQISKYLKLSWDMSDKQAKLQAGKERAKQQREEDDDSTTTVNPYS